MEDNDGKWPRWRGNLHETVQYIVGFQPGPRSVSRYSSVSALFGQFFWPYGSRFCSEVPKKLGPIPIIQKMGFDEDIEAYKCCVLLCVCCIELWRVPVWNPVHVQHCLMLVMWWTYKLKFEFFVLHQRCRGGGTLYRESVTEFLQLWPKNKLSFSLGCKGGTLRDFMEH